MENLGQDEKKWSSFFAGTNPLNEIAQFDYYGLRPYILRFCPRFGKVAEAGSGLGRIVFYLSKLGIDIEGVEFDEKNVVSCKAFAQEIKSQASFIQANVLNLPYQDNSLSGYISLGVFEHFVEGPQKGLSEALRVLKPGGIMILSTPNLSWSVLYSKIRFLIAKRKRMLLNQKVVELPFFQYWYTLRQLRKYVLDQGFIISRAFNSDYIYPLCEHKPFTYQIPRMAKTLASLEKYNIPLLGAQNMIIAIKPGNQMQCFLSPNETASTDSLKEYSVPISDTMQRSPLAEYYLRKNGRNFPQAPYQFLTPKILPHLEVCSVSGEEFESDAVFEDYGFDVFVSPSEIVKPEVNIRLAHDHVQMRWRPPRDPYLDRLRF